LRSQRAGQIDANMISDATRVKDALAKSGVEIDDVYDLVNRKVEYSKAIPVLIDLLENGIGDEVVREGVIRALAVKRAKGLAGPILIREFHRTPKEASLLRWAIGNSMEAVMTDDCTDAVIEIVQRVDNGAAREMFVLALAKVKNERAEQTLINLLEDEEVAAHAALALGKLKSAKAKKALHRLLDHPKPLIRQEAKKALGRIGKQAD
jgi:HEAT repeat protein